MVKNEKDNRQKLEAQKIAIIAENKELTVQVESTKGNVAHFLEEQAKVNAQKKELEGELAVSLQSF